MLVTRGVSPAVWLLTLAALVAVWRRNQTVLDLWLMVVMAVWLLDIALAAILGSAEKPYHQEELATRIRRALGGS